MDTDEMLSIDTQEVELVIEPETHHPSVSLHDVLGKMGFKYAIIDESAKDKGFTAEIRAEVPKAEDESYSAQCDTWVKRFGRVTGTKWIVTKTFPNSERWYHFRKLYTCQKSDHNTSRSKKKNAPKDANKGTGCKAVIDVKIRRDTPTTRKRDTLMKAGLQTKILVDFVHTHPVDFPEDLHVRPESGLEIEEETVIMEVEEPETDTNRQELDNELDRLHSLAEECDSTAVAALVDVLREIQTPKHLEYFSFTSKAVANIATHPSNGDNEKQKTWFVIRSDQDPS